jgi:predicted nuclease of predicted toxin-antitoxin system
MRFLLDEGLPFRLATHLQVLGHDVAAVGHDYPHALTDREILGIATAERRTKRPTATGWIETPHNPGERLAA